MGILLDKYARDFALWRDFAGVNYAAAIHLFDTDDVFEYFPAATLGHHALEMYLKSALILTGMTVFDPRRVKHLDPSIVLAENDCAWGHDLVSLGKLLAARCQHFDMSACLPFIGFVTIQEPLTVEKGLAIFDPFFTELRYPQEMKLMDGLGPEHRVLLDKMVKILQPARGLCRVASAP